MGRWSGRSPTWLNNRLSIKNEVFYYHICENHATTMGMIGKSVSYRYFSLGEIFGERRNHQGMHALLLITSRKFILRK
jgi:hypothetical protein